MNFDVEWIREATLELGKIWMNSPDREMVGRAAVELERSMIEDAAGLGESREPGMRIAFQGPLIVTFWVNEQVKRALVLHVRERR